MLYQSVTTLTEKTLSLIVLTRRSLFNRLLDSVLYKRLPFMMDRSAHSRNRPSNNHHPYHHHSHHGPGRTRAFAPSTDRYQQSGFPPPPPLGLNPLMPPSDFPPPPSHFWPVPPPFDPHSMPHPRPGPGGPGPAPRSIMGEPWFDQLPAPPNGFGHHHFPPPFPPDPLHGPMGAHSYRGGGTRGEGRGIFFNNVQNMADYTSHVFNMDFSNGSSNSHLSNSDGMSSGGNYLLPLEQQMHQENNFMPNLQSSSISPSKLHSPLRPMVAVNKTVDNGGAAPVTTVSVLCYNVLAQDLIRKNRYLYSDAVPELLEWDFRKTNLLRDLTDSNADILCLQEVQDDHFQSWFEPQLKEHGYTGIFQCRTGSHTDGCAVFYKTNTLQLIEWKGLSYRRTFKVLNRDNVGIVLKFAEQQSGESKQFCIATTHLLYNPKAGEVKLAQLSCLLAEMHKMATVHRSGGLLPTVLCGDFNSTPNSPLIDFITSSFLNYSKMSATEIAGYTHRKGQSRIIPSPLLPLSMNIGPNCTYVESENESSDVVSSTNGVESGKRRTGNDSAIEKETSRSTAGVVSTSQEGSLTSTSVTTAGGAGELVKTQNENFKENSDKEQSRARCVKQVRSARGAKARGMSYSGVRISDFPSLSGGKSSSLKGSPPPSDSQLSSGLQTPDDTNTPNSPTDSNSDAATLAEDSDMECEGEKNQVNQKNSTKCQVEHQSNSLACAGAGAGGGQLSHGEMKKRPPIHGLITHPFKFATAYPQSRLSTPSTVTTFHQSAFETVDYIFFTPSTGKKAGFHLLSRKALPSTHVLLDLGPQPHRYLSSDHLLLQACFQLVSDKNSRT